MTSLRSALLVLALVAPSMVRAAEVASSPAPSWTLKDVDGREVSSSQFKGKVVIVDFWATWCAPCRVEIPGYIALQEKYRDEGLVIIGISVDRQGPKVVKKFVAEQHVNYLMVMADDAVAEAFGVNEGLPTTVIIDRDGKIRDRKVGVVDRATYEQTVLKYLRAPSK
jgi:peroxiredoxin